MQAVFICELTPKASVLIVSALDRNVVHLSPGWSQAMPFHTWPGWHCPTIAGTHPPPCGVCPRGHGCAGAAAAQGRAGCAFPPTGSVGGGGGRAVGRSCGEAFA